MLAVGSFLLTMELFYLQLTILAFLSVKMSYRGLVWAAAEGGQSVSHELGGGGGNVLQSVLSKTTFGGLRNWGWSGRCPFLPREMAESRQKRGGNVS